MSCPERVRRFGVKFDSVTSVVYSCILRLCLLHFSRIIMARFPILAVALLFSFQAVAAELTVSAAASLTNAFRELAPLYEAKHPDTKVQLNFAASGALLQQIAKGAPVDVFASADQDTMDRAHEQGLIQAKYRS